MDEVLRFVLRLLGAFYLLAAVLALRAVAMDRLLTNALAAITLEPSGSADRFRNRFLTVSALLIGAGALALLTLLDLALPLLVAAVALQLLYLAYLAPRFVDPEESPEPGSRRKSLLATAMIAAVATLAFAAQRRGLLDPIAEAPAATALAAAAFAALAAYAVRLSFGADLARTVPSAADDAAAWEAPGDVEVDPAELAQVAIVLTPGWGRLGVLDARTGEELSYALYQSLLTQEERDLLADWNCLFIQVADPVDPRRVAMSAPDGLRRLAELGRPLHARIAARLGPERVSFEPAPRPQQPALDVAAVKVMADYACDPLWFHEDERVGCVSAMQFGLSWSLECALASWATAFDDSLAVLDMDDPGGPVRWSQAEAAAHLAEGRELAHRLAAELSATGRGHVRVVYHPSGGALETVSFGAAR